MVTSMQAFQTAQQDNKRDRHQDRIQELETQLRQQTDQRMTYLEDLHKHMVQSQVHLCCIQSITFFSLCTDPSSYFTIEGSVKTRLLVVLLLHKKLILIGPNLKGFTT